MAVFFANELNCVATFWRIYRADGITLGFTSHDRPLHFDGMEHRSAPGMVPSAIRRTASLSQDSAEVEGALSHDSICEADLAAGLYDGAHVQIGAVDWETLERAVLYSGTLGRIEEDRRGFIAELRSAKDLLEKDLVPRTSPTCRAEFCGPGCNLSAARFTQYLPVAAVDLDANTLEFNGVTPGSYLDGRIRFLDGPQTGVTFGIVQVNGDKFVLDRPLAAGTLPGTIVELREGCDHTLESCRSRFANAINFRGEPYLPGNDLLARYANPS